MMFKLCLKLILKQIQKYTGKELTNNFGTKLLTACQQPKRESEESTSYVVVVVECTFDVRLT